MGGSSWAAGWTWRAATCCSAAACASTTPPRPPRRSRVPPPPTTSSASPTSPSARASSSPPDALPSGGEPDRQRLELVEEQRFDGDRRSGELDLRIARQRLLEEDPQLQARQRGAQAEVPAARAEGLVLGFAPDVEAIRVLVARLVAV